MTFTSNERWKLSLLEFHRCLQSTVLWSQRQRTVLLFRAIIVTSNQHFWAGSTRPYSHRVIGRRPNETYTWCVALQERNTELREAEFFIMGSKHACPLLWKETLSLCSKVVCCINILEKVAQNKEEPLPHSQVMQQSERARENCLPTTLSECNFIQKKSTDCVFHLFGFLEHTDMTYVGKTFRIIVACGWVWDNWGGTCRIFLEW